MQQIILAAIDIVNTHGIKAVTTRRIAEKAGVNSAAMNYYFGSKENLIQKVTELTLSHLFGDWDMILNEPEMDVAVKVFFLLDFTMEGVIRYPGLTTSYFFDSPTGSTPVRDFVYHFSALSDRISSELQTQVQMSAEDIRYSLGQMMFTVISASMIPEMFTMVAKGDITSPETRSLFILRLMKGMLGVELTLTDSVLDSIALLREKAFADQSQ